MGIRKYANKKCLCGSGKKYKNCCIDKEDDVEFSNPLNFRESFSKVKKEARIKQCLYPDHATCSERVIGAHSIQNNKILKRISTNGYVYMPCPKSANPFAGMSKWGRKEATVFTGFCGYHDNEVFKPIENNLFDKSDYHCFLYAYRCFAMHFHKKQESMQIQDAIFKKRPSLITMSDDENPFRGMALAVNDFEHVRTAFDNALMEESYEILTNIIWEFPIASNFAASGFAAPEYDLRNKRIQNLLDATAVIEHIFITVFPEADNTYCIISWLKSNDDLFSELFEQFNLLDIEARKRYINNILPITTENIAVNPSSWDAMKSQ